MAPSTETEPLRPWQVFQPGLFPDYTYIPRDTLKLEERLRDFVDEGGRILTIAGPTKTGKTILVQSVVGSKWIKIESQGIYSVDVLWRRLADKLHVFSRYEFGDDQSESDNGRGGFKAGIVGLGVESSLESGTTRGSRRTRSVDRPIEQVVSEELIARRPVVVIDDFHFIDSDTQREVVRALKPLVFEGVPIVFVAITHRMLDVVRREPDMTGRLGSLEVKPWVESDLVAIASKGFQILNLRDPKKLSEELALNSFGSPQLMQLFCRELCKHQGFRERPALTSVLNEPRSWLDFFSHQLEDASQVWFQKLLNGPAPGGTERTIYKLTDGRRLDQYGLTLLAMKELGAKRDMKKSDLDKKVGSLVDGKPPAPHQTTRALRRMTKMAREGLSAPIHVEEHYDSEVGSEPDLQPILEYFEDTATMHLTDPYFTFFLKWGSGQIFNAASERHLAEIRRASEYKSAQGSLPFDFPTTS